VGNFYNAPPACGSARFDIWLMDKLPILRHGVGYAMLQVVMVGVLLGSIRLILSGGPSDRA
jgi:hypothetical protein